MSNRLVPTPNNGIIIGGKVSFMTLSERCDLVLAAGRTLFVNGQATDHTVAAAERLGRALGIRAELMPRWGELELKGERQGR